MMHPTTDGDIHERQCHVVDYDSYYDYYTNPYYYTPLMLPVALQQQSIRQRQLARDAKAPGFGQEALAHPRQSQHTLRDARHALACDQTRRQNRAEAVERRRRRSGPQLERDAADEVRPADVRPQDDPERYRDTVGHTPACGGSTVHDCVYDSGEWR